ncbi:hypothetical protein SUGI_0782690 [Cryptomeria japonica]|nr:hypothetical protein SUGI_0782690 [Cryptomeria japonica]
MIGRKRIWKPVGFVDYSSLLLSVVNNVERRLMSTCRAVVVPRFGGPEVLEVRQNVGIPDLGASEVLVRTFAVGINPLDCRVSSVFIF